MDLTLDDLAARFADPFLRAAVSNLLPYPVTPALFVLRTMGALDRRAAGYPAGGSLPVARTIERRYAGLGGRNVYRSPVAKVLERAGRAVGVRLASGDEVPADHLIAACDLRTALYSFLDGSRVDPVHQDKALEDRCARRRTPR